LLKSEMPEEQFGMMLGRGLLGAEEELVQVRELREVVLEEEEKEAAAAEEKEEEAAAAAEEEEEEEEEKEEKEEEEEEEVGSCCSSWQDGRSNAVRLGVRAA
jgi:hypothetical protein